MTNNNQALIPVKTTALSAMASRFNMEPATLLNTLKNTVFKGATNEQLAALVIVANEHGLNPFTREIYAFPDKAGGIQAVIGVDGWIRIITTNPAFNGVEFQTDKESCTCIMHVKGREHAVKVTEYLEECKRNTAPWQSHPRRMLRHKALIQAGRIAFGLGSLKDEDDVVVGPASVTVRPIFGQNESPALQLTDTPNEFASPEATVPAASPAADEPVDQPPAVAPARPSSFNALKAVRGLCKLGGVGEADLMEWLRTVGKCDESLGTLAEVNEVSPSVLTWLNDNWQAAVAEIKKARK